MRCTHIIIGIILLGSLSTYAQDQQQQVFVGRLEEDRAETEISPIPVRNDVAQPSEPIVTKRYWKIEKGNFPEFLKVSQEGVWPFFEKIGSRVIGMWLVVHPEETDSEGSPDYDEVYLMTQYASVEHWKATRKMAEMGGNGPDWVKAREAIAFRRSVTIETRLEFLQGSTWNNPPYYLPGLGESYAETKE
ncbi:MAG: hypothetical protein VCD00_13770 [Candidatus Hydrogenedentota bacterium]